MATPTQYYVDPSIAGDSGAGTSGDPYGDLQYALDNITRDATNGDQINIKAGTDEVLAAAIDLSTYGSPSTTARLIFRGYTSAANDGGIGGIDGNGTAVYADAGEDGVAFIDLHCHNCGSADVLNGDTNFLVIGCEIDNTTGDGIDAGANSFIIGCNIHNIGGIGVTLPSGSVRMCYFKNGTNDFSSAVFLSATGATAKSNIVSIDGSSNGIVISSFNNEVIANSILCAGGTGDGIFVDAALQSQLILNNLVEGFSGTGGYGINVDAISSPRGFLIAGNSCYNNSTDFSSNLDQRFVLDEDNESLGASPFAKSGSDTFANRATYFEPVDTGSVRGGAYVG